MVDWWMDLLVAWFAGSITEWMDILLGPRRWQREAGTRSPLRERTGGGSSCVVARLHLQTRPDAGPEVPGVAGFTRRRGSDMM
jgi:hypothetical protein